MCGDVAREADKKPLHSRGVPPDLADLVYVDPTELTDVVAEHPLGFRDGEVAQRGPASDSDVVGKLLHGEIACHPLLLLTGKQARH